MDQKVKKIHGFTGTNASINVMQPYKVVNRWHRTA